MFFENGNAVAAFIHPFNNAHILQRLEQVNGIFIPDKEQIIGKEIIMQSAFYQRLQF